MSSVVRQLPPEKLEKLMRKLRAILITENLTADQVDWWIENELLSEITRHIRKQHDHRHHTAMILDVFNMALAVREDRNLTVVGVDDLPRITVVQPLDESVIREEALKKFQSVYGVPFLVREYPVVKKPGVFDAVGRK